MKIIIISAIALLIYALIENRFMLKVRHEKLGTGIRIAHISDLHKRRFGTGNRWLLKKTADEKPDIIFISGDLITRDCTSFEHVSELLKRLCEIAPVYIIFGNHETDLPEDCKKTFTESLRESEAVLLENETVTAEINGRKFNISGIELKFTVYKKDGGYRNLDGFTIDEMKHVMGNKPEGETVLLVHNPLFAEVYSDWGADYAICGHVHGGIVRIPFTGIGVLSPERKFFPKYTKGVYTVGKMKLLVSGGLGKLRLFNPPEIIIYE